MDLLSSFTTTSSILHRQGAAFALYLLRKASPPYHPHTATLALISSYKTWWQNMYATNPFHVGVETFLIAFIIGTFLVTRGTKRGDKYTVNLTTNEKDELIKDWTPKTLTPKLSERERELMEASVCTKSEYNGSHFTHNSPNGPSIRCVNLSTFDFLGLSTRPEVKEASVAALTIYGCGSCGPRGFYGTITPHLELEGTYARIMGNGDSIMYSDANSCVSSTIAAFAKRGDLLVVDEGLYESLTTGVGLSRSNVKTFKHNDATSLRLVLEKISMDDKRLKRKVSEQRRFIVVEGIYRMSGDVAPLDEFVRLKEIYKYRMIVDESLSFGVMGETGLGACEHFNVMDNVEIRTVSLENVIGSIGGVTVGDEEVVDHQRLSGAGYCFSASAPPFVSSAAVASTLIMKSEGVALRKKLRTNIDAMRRELSKIKELTLWKGDEISPIIFLRLANADELMGEGREVMRVIARRLLEEGVSVTCTANHDEKTELLIVTPPTTIRITVNAMHDEKIIGDACKVIRRVVRECV